MDAPHRDNAPDLAPHDDATAKKGPRPRSGLKTFLVVLVIVFFQVDFVLFMLWADKTGIFGKPPPVEKSIEECRAEISAMDDDARISFVLNHDAYHEQVIASRLLGRNFICRLKQNKDEELYDRAKKFVDSWAGYADLVPPQYGVEFFLVNEKDVGIWQERLDKIYKNTLSEEQEKKENFMISMFMFRQDGICADGDWADWVADACRALDGSRSGRRTCNTFCDKLDIYQNNETAFRNEVLEFSGWSSGEDMLESVNLPLNYLWRAGMAIRVEGPDAARRVCGNLPAGGSREDCFKQIDYALADVAQSITNCDAYIDRFARILCGER